MAVTCDAAYPVVPATPYNLGPWFTIYVDGVKAVTSHQRDNRRPNANANPLHLGGRGIDRSFRGALDDVRFYDRVLMPVEVEDMYFAGQPLTGGGGLAPGSYDDPATTTVNESIGTLTVSSLELAGDTSLFYDFDVPGTCDLVQVEGDLILDGTLVINDTGSMSNGTYTIMTYTGTLTDNGLVVAALPEPFDGVVDLSVSGEVRIIIVGARLVELAQVRHRRTLISGRLATLFPV